MFKKYLRKQWAINKAGRFKGSSEIEEQLRKEIEKLEAIGVKKDDW